MPNFKPINSDNGDVNNFAFDLKEITSQIRSSQHNIKWKEKRRKLGGNEIKRQQKGTRLFKKVIEETDFSIISKSRRNYEYLPLFLKYLEKFKYKSEKSKVFIEKSLVLIRELITAKKEPNIRWLG